MTVRTATRWSVIVLLPALVLALGCQSTTPRERELAEQRWNVARARVKAELAADQLTVGNIHSAAGELDEAAHLDPDNLDLVPLRARLLLAQGQAREAVALLDRYQLDGPEQAPLDYLRGVAYEQQQQWEAAREAYRRAADAAPDEVAYLVAAVQTCLQLGQAKDALAMLLARSHRFRWQDAYHAAVAECHEQLENWSAAASAWRHVGDGADTDPDIQARLGLALFRAGRTTEAIPVLEETLPRLIGPASGPRLALAECYLSAGNTTAAHEAVRDVLRVYPNHVQALRLEAQIFSREGAHAKALRVAQRALLHSPDAPATLELTTALAWRIGEYDQAAQIARRLQEIEPDNPVARRILAHRPR